MNGISDPISDFIELKFVVKSFHYFNWKTWKRFYKCFHFIFHSICFSKCTHCSYGWMTIEKDLFTLMNRNVVSTFIFQFIWNLIWDRKISISISFQWILHIPIHTSQFKLKSISFPVPPMVWIQNQLVGSAIGQRVVLECQSEAFPKSINYWLKNDTIITQGM